MPLINLYKGMCLNGLFYVKYIFEAAYVAQVHSFFKSLSYDFFGYFLE